MERASWKPVSSSECPTGSSPLSTSEGSLPASRLPWVVQSWLQGQRCCCVLEKRVPSWLWEETLRKSDREGRHRNLALWGKDHMSCFILWRGCHVPEGRSSQNHGIIKVGKDL